MYHTLTRFAGSATGSVIRPPRLVRKPEVVHIAIWLLIIVFTAISVLGYRLRYSAARSTQFLLLASPFMASL
nr:MAG TPA: hypothetical protein [Siphoviridae sp. ctX2e5]